MVAHPDDDLYFMNPDLVHTLRTGRPHMSICLTCGEADGRNAGASKSRHATMPVDYQGYAASRFHGWRQAYADMVLGDRDAVWDRGVIVTAEGTLAELNTLRDAPHIQLVILNCWDNGASSPSGGGRVYTLWTGQDRKYPTMRPVGSPVGGEYMYTHDGLIRTLVGLFDRFRPTLVRTLDPDPDQQTHDAQNPQYSDWGDFSDHQSHVGTALFTFAALQQWWQRDPGARTAVETYRGYYNRRWPSNLSLAARRLKERYVRVYAGVGASPCDLSTGCGDLKIGSGKLGNGYGRSTTRRYPPAPTWLHLGNDGRLVAFAVLGGRAVMWREHRPGSGMFDDPVAVGGGPLLPQLSALRLRDGRWQLFAIRMTLDADPGKQARDLVTTVQSTVDGSFGDWVNLGNPHDLPGVDPVRRRGVGIPVAAVRGDGQVQVFVRNFGKGIGSRLQLPDGSWGPWLDLQGTDTQDGLAARGTGSGPAEVFASGKAGILRWREAGADGAFDREVVRVPAPAGPPCVVRVSDGRLLLLVREAGTGGVVGYAQQRAGGSWVPRGHLLGGTGVGAVSAAPLADKRVLIVARTDDGGISYVETTLGAEHPRWTPVAAPIAVGTPAVATNANGRPVIAAVMADGRLWTHTVGTGAAAN
ncbi:PIG-L family deacetylase [Planosporangium sp. 12N6]|uniref:PIG-L family deacetylase n=1 Tax=Planosporangium spinosum TaxID=3402278 RepID=UPI003CEFCBDA